MSFLEDLERVEDAVGQFTAVSLPDLLALRHPEVELDLDMLYHRLVGVVEPLRMAMITLWHEAAAR